MSRRPVSLIEPHRVASLLFRCSCGLEVTMNPAKDECPTLSEATFWLESVLCQHEAATPLDLQGEE